MRLTFPTLVLALLATRPALAQDLQSAADSVPQDSLVLVDMARCRAAAAGTPVPAETLLVVARAIRSELWSDSSLVCFKGYLAQGGDSGLALLEEARTLFEVGRAQEARAAWFSGAGHARGDEARAQYRADIGWIAVDSELVAFDSVPADSLRGWLDAFWVARDVADARIPGDRLTEHYRRWWHVMRNYKGRRARRLRDIGALRRAYRDSVDDRGLVYMRYGEPAEIATWNGATTAADVRASQAQQFVEGRSLVGDADISDADPRVQLSNTQEALEANIERLDQLSRARPQPNLSWRYDLPEGPLVLHFVAFRSAHYQLVESLTDAFGYGVGIRLATGALGVQSRIGPGRTDPLLNLRSLFDSRSAIDPAYGTMAMIHNFGGSRQLSDERVRGRVSMETATSTDRFAHRFDRALQPIVQVYGLGPAADAAGRVMVVFAVPGEPLVTGGRLEGRPFYPIRVRVVVSEGNRLVTQIDTMRQFVMRGELRDGRYLSGIAEVPVPPGEYRVQVVLAQALGGAGAAIRLDSVRVPAIAAGSLELSDIVVGRRGSGLSWQHRGRALPLNPLNAFTRSAAAELYYEVSGLAAGEQYRAEIELRREKGGKRAVALAFAERATGNVTPVHQTVDLSTVRPGRYSLVLQVTSTAGATATRTATLYVIEPRSYRDADEVVARTMPVRASEEAVPAPSVTRRRDERVTVTFDSARGRTRALLPRLLSEKIDDGTLQVDVGLSHPGAGPAPAEGIEVIWTVTGQAVEPHRLVFALQGDRHIDLGTGARRDGPAGTTTDEYRMPIAAWYALLQAESADLFLDDIQFKLTRKKELAALAALWTAI